MPTYRHQGLWVGDRPVADVAAYAESEGRPSEEEIAAAKAEREARIAAHTARIQSDPRFHATRGRAGASRRTAQHRLSDAQVREGRRLYARGGWSYDSIARRYGVDRTTAERMLRRITYRWVR